MFKPYQADSLEALARALNLDPSAFCTTLGEYNRATSGQIEQRLETPDGNGTRGISPPKSNWAIPIDTPPFYGLPLRPASRSPTWAWPSTIHAACSTQTGSPFHECLRGGRNHVRQYSDQGLSRGLRHDDRRRVRRTCGKDGGHECPSLICSRKPTASWSSATPAAIARGCARSSAPSRRAAISEKADVFYLANLCHDCRVCYYACMFTPPHEFAINIPQILSEARVESYQQWSWPGFLGRAFRQTGITLVLAAS